MHVHKPGATIFTRTPDGDFTEGNMDGRETQADVAARQERWERVKIDIFAVLVGLGLSAYFGIIVLLAYGAYT